MSRIILTGLSVITGLLFINGGVNKFLHYMPVPEDLPDGMLRDMAALEEISWLLPLIAVGILLTHLTVDPGQLVIPLVIWAVLLWIMVADRRKLLPLLAD